MNWIRQHVKILIPVGIAGAAVAAYFAFAVFGVHTLFIDDKVDEAGPVFASGASADESPAADPAVDSSPTSASPEVSEEVETSEPTTTRDTQADPEPEPAPSATTDVPPATPPLPPTTAEPSEPQIVTLAEGSFIPRGRYSGEGQALVLNDGSEQRFLRFENFSTDNGPDLSVYLVNSDANADGSTFDDDFVDLGGLAGNIGDQNYEIPPEVDLAVYDTVVVWCVRFATAFTAADLVAV